jgi:folate-dependent phosphoribosylglycinamide formyltransferase PurN
MNRPSVILLTSNELRHRYVASILSEKVDMLGIVAEQKRIIPAISEAERCNQDTNKALLEEHFKERGEVEKRFFGCANFPKTQILYAEPGEANANHIRDWIKERQPEFVLLYGTSIIKPPLLTDYQGCMVNMHLGLSPYYRGAGTNFWPLVDGLPECVGATIHLAVQKVDAGGMLCQVRPDPIATDGPHDLGCRTIVAGATAYGEAVVRFARNEIQPVVQNLNLGKVYKKKDFTANAVEIMRANFESGMMTDYCAEQSKRCKKYPIHEL